MKTSDAAPPLQNIVCLGDSLTEVRIEAEIDRWPTRLQMALEAWKPKRFKVFNRGVSGCTTADALERIQSDVEPHLPALVLVAFGANDANVRKYRNTARVSRHEFEANLREINLYVRCHHGKCLFIATHYPHRDPGIRTGNGKTSMENYRGHCRAILAVGKALGIPVIDMTRFLKRRKLTAKDIVCPDGIHLSTHGNHVYASILFDELKSLFEKGTLN